VVRRLYMNNVKLDLRKVSVFYGKNQAVKED